jgi:predicted DNA-binding antitoxin AbrB/MazE fold protein
MLENQMVKTIEAVFDGNVLRPEGPLALEPNTRVRITIETMEPSPRKVKSFLDTARSLNVDAPPDWAVNIAAYLHDGEDQRES